MCAVVCGFLSIDPRDVDPSRSLASTARLAVDDGAGRASKTHYGRSLPEWLIAEHPTLAALTDVLCAGEAAAIDLEGAIMRADCQLPADIRPAAGPIRDEMRHVLLTGATGFLGAALLRALLEDRQTRVTCLVRSDPGHSRRRLRAALTLYGAWDEIDESRIDAVEATWRATALALPQTSTAD
jgi:hypothetical protein